ncbi:hypothetical protein BJ878DRAFT_533657 [Calycina marina]|uniref:Uncharacterized protein n=1 Tax=Calycina marina TaxID=1763456 RepID=A0A9P8CHT0_9HELO|nr:hypothetical protein BJ878DRAFT_533657 [Calycina marina]
MTKKLQFVWPKDGPKGRSGHRGFWGRMNNIVTNRGPDVFIQRQGSRTGIRPDWWGNWDSYHDPGCDIMERNEPRASRRQKRYDPESRRYVDWTRDNNWSGDDFAANLLGGPPVAYYPRFTQREWDKIDRKMSQGKWPNPRKMGSDWNYDGPERFQQRHDWFWQDAHRIGENDREQLPQSFGPNPFLHMHQQDPMDFPQWIMDEPWPYCRRTVR